jgi:peroxiredoxin
LVRVAKPGYGEVTREVNVDPDDEFPPFVDVQLRGAAAVSGVVRDFRTSDPVAGADVEASFGYQKRSTQTEADGTFEITALPPGPARLTIEAASYGREKREIRSTEGAQPLVVELKPERVIHLRTVDEDGKPVGGVGVECLDETRRDYRSLASDAQGRLTIRNVHYDARSWALRLTHQSYVSSQEFDREVALPDDPIESTHTLVLERAGAIAGKVIERATNDPANGARVTAGSYAYGRNPRDFAGFDGTYHIVGVKPGRQAVTVFVRGYAPELAEVEVVAGQVAELDVRLDPPGQVGGTVVDRQGKPLAGAHVMSVKWRGHQTLGLQALTDESGGFVIPDAPADEFLVTLLCPGHEPLYEQPIRAPKMDYHFEMTAAGPGGQPGAAVKVGDEAPPFELTILDGRTIKLADLKGKYVLLDFWATWCIPCVREVPNLQAVHKAFADRDDFVMIGISLDQDQKALERFLTDQKVTWPQAFGQKGGTEKASRDYGAYAIPAVFLIGPDGKVTATDVRGPGMKDQIGRLLDG